MLGNYLKVFLCNLLRQKTVSIITLAGLAVGIAVFLLIMRFVVEEYSHGQRWERAERIVRTVDRIRFNADTQIEIDSGSQRSLEKMLEFFPGEIDAGTRVWNPSLTFIVGEQELREEVDFVDAAFPEVFSLVEIQGSIADTLAEPGRLALEEELANKLFAGKALGQALVLRQDDGTERDAVVTAIYRLPEGTGNIRFPSLSLLVDEGPAFNYSDSDWTSGQNMQTWLLLREPADVERINQRMGEFVEQYVRVPWMSVFDGNGVNYASYSIWLQPLLDMHFNPLTAEEGQGSKRIVDSFAWVAVLILVIAVTNFVILSVAGSTDRVREVAIRKANGARIWQVQGQFLFETFVWVVIAFALALTLLEVIKPVFENLMRVELTTRALSARWLPWELLLIVALTLLGGAYPAWLLSSTPAEQALKSRSRTTSGSLLIRKALIGLQFTIATGLIIVTLVIYQQLDFLRHRDMGLDADRVVSLGLSASMQAGERSDVLLNEIASLDGVEVIAPVSRVASRLLGNITYTSLGTERGGGNRAELSAHSVGYDFFELYAMNMLAGRSFSRERDPLQSTGNATVVQKIVLNESAVRDLALGRPPNAIGRFLYAELPGPDGESGYAEYEIIGVVRDSQFDSLRTPPKSEMYRLSGPRNAALSFRVSEHALDGIVEQIEAIWDDVVGVGSPGLVFGRDTLAETFAQEQNQGRLLLSFTLLALVISCMGLYGLVRFDTERRTKEIGVRKVFGGSHGHLQHLFLSQYLLPLLLANVIGWLGAVWLMQQWLQQFPYRIGPWGVLLACASALFLVLLVASSTLGSTVRRAYRVRPAEALRYE